MNGCMSSGVFRDIAIGIVCCGGGCLTAKYVAGKNQQQASSIDENVAKLFSSAIPIFGAIGVIGLTFRIITPCNIQCRYAFVGSILSATMAAGAIFFSYMTGYSTMRACDSQKFVKLVTSSK